MLRIKNTNINFFILISCILLCYNIQPLYYIRHNTTNIKFRPFSTLHLDISCVVTDIIKRLYKFFGETPTETCDWKMKREHEIVCAVGKWMHLSQ
jgi:hypothetical protein